MSNRIDLCFERLRRDGARGFIAYIGAGDPSLEKTEKLAIALEGAGVDVLELGIPFSDPLADGLVNQLAAQRGLESGTTPEGVLECVERIRQSSQIPIVLYVYYNILHRRGVEAFVRRAADAGVDGILTLDLPPEEFEDYASIMKAANVAPIVLVAPTTPESRMAEIVKHASGFVYYISREGVTGMQSQVAASLDERVAAIREFTNLPIAIGFGVSSPEQARQVAEAGDAVVVGSAIVNQIAEHGNAPDLPQKVASFTQELVRGAKKAGANG